MRTTFVLSFFSLVILAISPAAVTETELADALGEFDEQTVQLSDKEILDVFSNVRDDAEVQYAAEVNIYLSIRMAAFMGFIPSRHYCDFRNKGNYCEPNATLLRSIIRHLGTVSQLLKTNKKKSG